MELYKWYNRDQVPDRQCWCVVSYWAQHNIIKYSVGRIFQYANIWEIVTEDEDRIGYTNLIAWMPIEFPEEVE